MSDAVPTEEERLATFARHLHLLPEVAEDAPPLPAVAWSPLDPAARRDRALGCLLGLAVGDALGAAVSPDGGAPGAWTGNTGTALCLAHSLLDQGTFDQYDFMERLRDWLEHGQNTIDGTRTDAGATTRAAIAAFINDDDPAAGPVDGASAGNGSLVRSAPLAIAFAGAPGIARFQAVRQSRTTHGTIECLDACELFTAQLVDALDGADFAAATRPRVLQLSPNVMALNGGDWRAKDRAAVRSGGYVVATLEAALWAVGSTGSFRGAVTTAVDLGADPCAAGAVAGQLAGALNGASAIPAEWLDQLAWREHLEELASDLMVLESMRV